jgi:hypothetical protein
VRERWVWQERERKRVGRRHEREKKVSKLGKERPIGVGGQVGLRVQVTG